MQQDFFQQVYDIVQLIPKGRITTYGAIAVCLGSKKTARMVGWAMNNAPSIIPAIPTHRVVNRKGILSGRLHFATPLTMQHLLEKEGITIINNKVQDFQKKLWLPLEEILL